MFVFSKGKPKTFNPLMQKKKCTDTGSSEHSKRLKDGTTKKYDAAAMERLRKADERPDRIKDNIWYIPTGFLVSARDAFAFQHPAIFPEKLANDHIVSWSNEGDIVFDPFVGSGTTAKMAVLNNRHYIGFDISEEYCKIAEQRVEVAREMLRNKEVKK